MSLLFSIIMDLLVCTITAINYQECTSKSKTSYK